MIFDIKNADIGYDSSLISGVNTHLKNGDVCLLIGNNGVGKTTLIKSILHQIPLLNGEISIDKQNIKKLSVKEVAEKIAIVFSKSPVPQNQTVYDLISLGKFIYYPYYFKLKNTDQKEIDEIISSLKLNQYRNTLLKNLSDGNLQKAFIGRAIAQNSAIIILDEPTTHLDEKNKIIILKTLRELAKKQNKIILFSSHDWRLAKEFTDQIWYIKGEKLHSGLVEDILLQHHELTDVSLFKVNKNFIPPHIFAPKVEKEMLFSLLQKNYDTDLSDIIFTFKENIWQISYKNNHHQCLNFGEILLFLNNLH
ncbi:ABC transporter [Chryseobacterium sp. Leaf180]|uniref:ABC transporter ATP-binding protein n=1 Tax=Chryseobacterium sp. Leaf180 TaxID=1736289 RepID=UPI0006F2056B|nr:ABC transporter ATP-binding protein [Chryseobacterium sp. Leaf180]KQR94690.1 ABC transporter [Chryseobacterium sp. Leaf180]